MAASCTLADRAKYNSQRASKHHPYSDRETKAKRLKSRLAEEKRILRHSRTVWNSVSMLFVMWYEMSIVLYPVGILAWKTLSISECLSQQLRSAAGGTSKDCPRHPQNPQLETPAEGDSHNEWWEKNIQKHRKQCHQCRPNVYTIVQRPRKKAYNHL